MTAEWNMSHERHELLCHKTTFAHCTLLPQLQSNLCMLMIRLDYYLFKLIAGRESCVWVCWVSEVDF